MTKITRLCLLAFILCSTLSFSGNSSVNLAESSFSTEDIQRVRIYFTTPLGYVRHLLLAFTPDNAASDSYNYGYDALNRDNLADDLSWMIGEQEFVIQGVGAFDENKQYPLGMFLTNGGNIKIDLLETENFANPIEIFIYDSELDTYTKINEHSYTEDMTSGEYLNRFYIAFKDGSDVSAKNSLSTNEIFPEETKIAYLSNSKQLLVNTPENIKINKISLYNINGQLVLDRPVNQIQKTKISLNHLKIGTGIVYVETDYGLFSKKVLIH